MKILVTGGAGFIGSHIVDRYIEEGFDVIVIDNLSTGKKENVNKKAKLYIGDITKRKFVEKVFLKEKPEIINHHAAFNNFPKSFIYPKKDALVNIFGTLNLILAAKKVGSVKKIIYASSGGLTYGINCKIPVKEGQLPDPVGPYAISKYAAELYIKAYSKRIGYEYTILRYANVYGPRQDPSKKVGIVSILIDKVMKGKNPRIRGSGKQTRDFVYVKDVAEANLKAIKYGNNDIFNIGSGKETSIEELFEIIKKILKKPYLKLLHKPAIEGDERRFCMDISKAKKKLRWKPKYSLKKGITETIRYKS